MKKKIEEKEPRTNEIEIRLLIMSIQDLLYEAEYKLDCLENKIKNCTK